MKSSARPLVGVNPEAPEPCVRPWIERPLSTAKQVKKVAKVYFMFDNLHVIRPRVGSKGATTAITIIPLASFLRCAVALASYNISNLLPDEYRL